MILDSTIFWHGNSAFTPYSKSDKMKSMAFISNMLQFCMVSSNTWHDQGKWVTCRKFQFPFSLNTVHHFLKTSKCFIFMQTPLRLDIWLQSYEGVDKTKNHMKQRYLCTLFLPISQKKHICFSLRRIMQVIVIIWC